MVTENADATAAGKENEDPKKNQGKKVCTRDFAAQRH
jgi:hypothetical protein